MNNISFVVEISEKNVPETDVIGSSDWETSHPKLEWTSTDDETLTRRHKL